METHEARKHAEAHIADGHLGDVELANVVDEREFGFLFGIRSRDVSEIAGVGGVLVERAAGEVHDTGSAFGADYWFEAFERGLDQLQNVIVTKVIDRQRAAEALLRLHMTSAGPELADGETRPAPQLLGLKALLKSFDDLPARFEKQNLILGLEELKRIEAGGDVAITLERHGARQAG